jgi:NAD(P)-dependent dehydrogenase (short-subunit alcohol dehydrogenase family)
MSGRFDGHGAIVTGGASGIGLATARRLREEGATVAILDRADGLDALAAGAGALAVEVDLTDPAATGAAVERAFDSLDVPCDLLVNSAGVHRVQPLDSVSAEDWDRVMRINAAAPLWVAQAFVRSLGSRPGAIVNVSSIGADRVARTDPAAPYRASKGALNALTREMAVEWAPRVRVNAVSPGPIETPMLPLTRLAAGEREEAERAFEAMIPMGRVGTPDDVAAAICFLLSDQASYLTAVDLPVDGGILAC